jgi:hypothetical protein
MCVTASLGIHCWNVMKPRLRRRKRVRGESRRWRRKWMTKEGSRTQRVSQAVLGQAADISPAHAEGGGRNVGGGAAKPGLVALLLVSPAIWHRLPVTACHDASGHVNSNGHQAKASLRPGPLSSAARKPRKQCCRNLDTHIASRATDLDSSTERVRNSGLGTEKSRTRTRTDDQVRPA